MAAVVLPVAASRGRHPDDLAALFEEALHFLHHLRSVERHSSAVRGSQSPSVTRSHHKPSQAITSHSHVAVVARLLALELGRRLDVFFREDAQQVAPLRVTEATGSHRQPGHRGNRVTEATGSQRQPGHRGKDGGQETERRSGGHPETGERQVARSSGSSGSTVSAVAPPPPSPLCQQQHHRRHRCCARQQRHHRQQPRMADAHQSPLCHVQIFTSHLSSASIRPHSLEDGCVGSCAGRSRRSRSRHRHRRSRRRSSSSTSAGSSSGSSSASYSSSSADRARAPSRRAAQEGRW